MKLKKLSDTEKKIVCNTQWKQNKQDEAVAIVKDFLATGEDVMEIERDPDDDRKATSIMMLFKRSILNNNIRGAVTFTAGNRVFLSRGEFPESQFRKAAKVSMRTRAEEPDSMRKGGSDAGQS